MPKCNAYVGAPAHSSGHGDSRFHSQNSAVQEHHFRVGIISVFLAYRKSLEIVKDRKMEVLFFFFIKGKKKCIFPSCTYPAGIRTVEMLLLHGCSDGEGAAQWVTLGNYLLSCLKLLDCSFNHNYKLSKSCNRYWFFANVILRKMGYTWACAINSTQSSSETPRYNEYWKRCHTNNQELTAARDLNCSWFMVRCQYQGEVLAAT